MLCPVCENEAQNDQKCNICGWEFLYTMPDSNKSEQEEYMILLQNYRTEFLAKLNTQVEQPKAIIKLTPEILEKDMFETTEQYADRIEKLGYIDIGTVEWQDYDANTKKLKFRANINKDLSAVKFSNKPHKIIYEINLEPVNAKQLYENIPIPLLSTLKIIDSKISLTDMKINDYSFMNEFLKHKELYDEKIKQKKIQQDEQKKQVEKERLNKIAEEKEIREAIKNLPQVFFDKKSNLEWRVQTTREYKLNELYSFNQSNSWAIPTLNQIEYLIDSLKESENIVAQAFLEDMYTKGESIWVKYRFEKRSMDSEYSIFSPSIRKYESSLGSVNSYDKISIRIRGCRIRPRELPTKKTKTLWSKLWN